MRIGLDGAALVEPKTGIGHYVYELAQHLARSRPEDSFELISHYQFHSEAIAGVQDGLPNLAVTYHPVGKITGRWWSIGLPAYLRRAALDIFHGTNYEIPLWGRRPAVLSIHDLSRFLHPDTHESKHVKRSRRLLPLMARRATMIITPCESVRKEVCETLGTPAGKVSAVPYAHRACFTPLPPTECRPVRERLGVEEEFLLYVGTIEPRKGLLTLLQAFESLLRETTFRPQLVLAGKTGWLNDEVFTRLRNSPAKNRILLTGYLPDSDIQALYSSAGIVVYPSVYEGFGLPPLEAMACGAPVIVSAIPAVMETVGAAALLAEPRDANSFARQIIQLLGNPQARSALSAAGRLRASSFSWEKTASGTYEVYVEALRRGRGALAR